MRLFAEVLAAGKGDKSERVDRQVAVGFGFYIAPESKRDDVLSHIERYR